jgi:hypothetical protein
MFQGDPEKVALLSGVCVLAAFRSLADVISERAVKKIWRKNEQALAEGAFGAHLSTSMTSVSVARASRTSARIFAKVCASPSRHAEDLLDFTTALLERLVTEPKRLEQAEARGKERRKPRS